MSQPPSNAPANGDVDSKLDSLISRIQSLSGEGKAERPKQQPRPAAGATPVSTRPAQPRPAAGPAARPASGPSPAAAGQSPPGNPATSRPAVAASPPTQQSSPAAASAGKPAKPSLPMPLGFKPERNEPWRPIEPEDMYTAGVNETILEAIIYRFLLNIGEAEGRKVADQVKLPFRMVEPLLTRLKMEQNVAYKNSTATNDYVYTLTESGRGIARNHIADCTYYGACPVPLAEYITSIKLQTIEGQYPKRKDLLHAFKDLLINPRMLEKLGPAVASGRGMFLFGFPGNGKTSIAERVTGAFGKYIWIPRAIDIDGDVLRVFDPMCHELAMPDAGLGLLDIGGFDKRWVRIERPTIVAGGELTMDMLEVQCNVESNISEAPLQLKSNCGTLVIDDFGRQRMPVDELLNRWIVPLEKRYDFLNLPSGKKIQVPFDQLIVFSTNLEPRDLVDGAFLRRIPYKIQVPDPSEQEFKEIMQRLSPAMGFEYDEQAVQYLIDTHFHACDRHFRSCHPRDLLLQVRNYCTYHQIPRKMTREAFDFAIENYFSVI